VKNHNLSAKKLNNNEPIFICSRQCTSTMQKCQKQILPRAPKSTYKSLEAQKNGFFIASSDTSCSFSVRVALNRSVCRLAGSAANIVDNCSPKLYSRSSRRRSASSSTCQVTDTSADSHCYLLLGTVDNHGIFSSNAVNTVIMPKCRAFCQNAVVLRFHKNILFLVSII